jgi:hypothetical protein
MNRHSGGTITSKNKNLLSIRNTIYHRTAISSLEDGEEVHVVEMPSETVCRHEMFVSLKWMGRELSMPLIQLEAIEANIHPQEAIADWHYWIGRGH